MQEDLIGYLLSALEPQEMRRIERLLQTDPALRTKLRETRELLRGLEEMTEPESPQGSDRVSRTLDALPPLPRPESGGAETSAGGAGAGDHRESLLTDSDVPSSSGRLRLPTMRGRVESTRIVTWSWMDWAASAVAAAVLLGLLLPSLAEGRFASRKVACQDQLRGLGTALTQYVDRSSSKRLPRVAESGPEAFAGVYAVRLKDAGLLPDESIRWCPSLDPPARPQPDGRSYATSRLLSRDASLAVPVAVPDQLGRVGVDELRVLQQSAGGHYAYTLGVLEGERLASPKFESRSSFAVMSDAPLEISRESAGRDGWGGSSPGHSGRGINVLFEDGRVQFISLDAVETLLDHPFENHLGENEAGIHGDDASLGPSWRPPFLRVRQR